MALVRCTCIVGPIVPGKPVVVIIPDEECGYVLHRAEVPASA